MIHSEKAKTYLRRLGLPEDMEISHTYKELCDIQYAHACRIPYENLDIMNGTPIALTPDALYDKIVTRGRGGYCFELNGALGWLLRELGFSVTDYFARFLRGEAELPMRRHRILRVTCAEGDCICDVGVGQIAPRYPLFLKENEIQTQFGETYRFQRDETLGWILWEEHKGEWRQYLSFFEEPHFDVDFIQPSFYCEKHPDSPFPKALMLAIKTEKGRKTVDGDVYKEFEGGTLTVIEENLSKEALDARMKKDFYLYL